MSSDHADRHGRSLASRQPRFAPATGRGYGYIGTTRSRVWPGNIHASTVGIAALPAGRRSRYRQRELGRLSGPEARAGVHLRRLPWADQAQGGDRSLGLRRRGRGAARPFDLEEGARPARKPRNAARGGQDATRRSSTSAAHRLAEEIPRRQRCRSSAGQGSGSVAAAPPDPRRVHAHHARSARHRGRSRRGGRPAR